MHWKQAQESFKCKINTLKQLKKSVKILFYIYTNLTIQSNGIAKCLAFF